MIIMLNPSNAATTSIGRSGVLREFVPRTDRVPQDQRIDIPEVQESYRVSFSNAALAAASGRVRDTTQQPTFTEERGANPDPRLLAYRSMAAL